MKLLQIQKETSIVDKEGRPTNYFIQYELQGFTGTIPLAKITSGGVNGFITFSQGKVVGVQEPT